MDLDIAVLERMTAAQAREMAERASAPQRICEDHFYRLIKLFIRQQASQGAWACTYSIPGFALGLPLYKPEEVARALEMRLTKEGWRVSRVHLNLEIGWRAAPRTFLKTLHK